MLIQGFMQKFLLREAFKIIKAKVGKLSRQLEGGVYPDLNLLTGFLKILRMPGNT